MAPALPTPSKGALRALRQIALGTSCTVAFGAGLISEDRRRRIHSAREVCENGRRIKALRKYHSGSISVAATFDECAFNHVQLEPWKEGRKSTKSKLRRVDEQHNIDSSVPLAHVSGSDEVQSKPMLARASRLPKIQLTSIPDRVATLISPKPLPLKPANIGSTVALQTQPSIGIFNRQQRLARDIIDILGQGHSMNLVNAAIARFFEAFAAGIKVETLGKPLIDACSQLSRACERNGRFDTFIPILKKILQLGPIDEECYYALNAPLAAVYLLKASEQLGSDGGSLDVEKLKDAVTIFLTKFSERPALLPSQMRVVGERLCAATFSARLYEMTDAIYWRLAAGSRHEPPFGVHYLILAQRGRGSHKAVLQHFERLYVHSHPDQTQFYKVGSAVVNSALDLERLDKAESVVRTATEMAVAGGLLISTTWLLQILGKHWRMTRDLQSTQALFDRLESLLGYTGRPHAMYSAIIQFCIEAGNEKEARKYVDRLAYTKGTGTPDIRTCGHFALAKAMEKDWQGVEADFRAMSSFAFDSKSEFAAVFTPIFKLFAASHDVYATEQFIHTFIEKFGVIPNSYISNIMIEKYAEAQEIDCIPAWIEYISPMGLKIDSVTLNIILSSCREKWHMSFKELLRISRKAEAVDVDLIDSGTLNILHGAAVAGAKGDSDVAGRLLHELKSFHLSEGHADLRTSMRDALAKGSPITALKIYKSALTSNVRIEQDVLAMAIEAALRSADSNDVGAAADLLKEARSRGCEVGTAMTPLLLHQIGKIVGDADAVERVLKDIVAALAKRELKIPMIVATKAASILVNSGKNRRAVDLWTSLSNISALPLRSVDLVSLTVLLKAYIALSDLNGIDWVMRTLAQNDIVPDARFRLLLKNARKDARKARDRYPGDVDAIRLHSVLDQCLQRVVARRAEAVVMREKLERKTLHMIETASMVRANDRIANPVASDLSNNHSYYRLSAQQEKMNWANSSGRVGSRIDPSSIPLETGRGPCYDAKELRPNVLGLAAA